MKILIIDRCIGQCRYFGKVEGETGCELFHRLFKDVHEYNNIPGWCELTDAPPFKAGDAHTVYWIPCTVTDCTELCNRFKPQIQQSEIS